MLLQTSIPHFSATRLPLKSTNGIESETTISVVREAGTFSICLSWLLDNQHSSPCPNHPYVQQMADDTNNGTAIDAARKQPKDNL